MIEFTLNGLGQNDKINFVFLNNYFNNLKLKKYKKIKFNVFGNFPQCSWAGNFNNTSSLLLFNEIKNIITTYTDLDTSIFLDCGNIVFSNENFGWDAVGNTVLKLIDPLPGTKIEISNLKAYQYFQNIAPLKLLILSNKWNENFDNLNFDRQVIFPRNLSSIDNKKNNIEIELNNLCNDCTEENWGQCIIKETDNICSFKNQSIYTKCPIYLNNIQSRCNDNNINEYLKLGYTHFRFPNYSLFNPIIQLSEYTKVLIEEKYQKEFLNLLILDYYR